MIHGVTVYVLVIVYFSYYTGSDYNAVGTHSIAARLKKQNKQTPVWSLADHVLSFRLSIFRKVKPANISLYNVALLFDSILSFLYVFFTYC